MDTNAIIKNVSNLLKTDQKDIENYLKKFSKKIVVIKFGGHAMGDRKLSHTFAEDVTILQKLGIRPVVIHGGGPQIGSMLKKLNIVIDNELNYEIFGSSRMLEKVLEQSLTAGVNVNPSIEFQGNIHSLLR